MFIILDNKKNIIQVCENAEQMSDGVSTGDTIYVGDYSFVEVNSNSIPTDIFTDFVYKFENNSFVKQYPTIQKTDTEVELESLRSEVSTMKVALDELIFGGMI